MSLQRFISGLVLACGLWMGASVHAQTPNAMATAKLEKAELSSLAGKRWVNLPHVLDSNDFTAEGSSVTYKLQVKLFQLPAQSVGIYVPQIALAGNVSVNGHFLASCERGETARLRCLHRPHLFTAPVSLWKQGMNEVTFQVHADAHQNNGLSSVLVGDVNALDKQFYRLRHWLEVDLLQGLTWLSTLLGILTIAAAMLLRKDSVYRWFGWASAANAIANSGVLLSRAPLDVEGFNWLVSSSRFLTAALMLLMFISFFDRLKPWMRNTVLFYTAMGMALIGLSDARPSVVLGLYAPLILSGLFVNVLMLIWTWKSHEPKHLAATLSMCLLWLAGGYDGLQRTGLSGFESIHTIPYAFSGVLFLYGSLLLGLLAHTLVQTQELKRNLEARIAERTDALNKIHNQLMTTEIARSKSQERERMLQDMHDGFGSQLVTAKIMVEQKKMSQESLAQLLHECISDLYLVVDTLGNSENSLANAFIDFRFRTQQRLIGNETQLHWDLQLDKAPETPQQMVLQILRITQEALNNALKHAKAQNIWISAIYKPSNRMLYVAVYDDGAGMSTTPAHGRGKNNMLARARTIKAELSLSNRQIGTLMSLNVPLNAATTQPGHHINSSPPPH
jgi:signal transduction histidine kinase